MTTPNAIDTIKAVVKELGDKVLMGVGTVLDDITARLAILARRIRGDAGDAAGRDRALSAVQQADRLRAVTPTEAAERP